MDEPTDRPHAPLARVALYSHDTQGLGHVRRNIAVAAALVAADPATNVLLLTGAPEATALPLPPRTEVLTLPTLAKDVHGAYASRVLDAPLTDVLALRGSVMTAALLSFSPDLLVVDKVPAGVGGELLDVLRRLRAETGATVVLGLREVLDDPDSVMAEWARDRTDEVLAELYDAVWVYGDPAVYDPVVEYGLSPAVAAMVTYTGYLGRGRADGTRTRARASARARPPRHPYLLCLVGGGQDGFDLAHDFLRAPVPAGHEAVAVSGPYMSSERRRRLRATAERTPGTRLLEFVPEAAEFVAGAWAVVSMAGYNSVCEVLAAGRPALLVPRVRPRREQLVRAERLSVLGLADMLHPDDSSPERIGRWLQRTTDVQRLPGACPVDLDGLALVPHLARSLVGRALGTTTAAGETAQVVPPTAPTEEDVRVAV